MCDLILEADIIVGKSGGGFELITATPTNTHADLLDGIRGIGNSTLGIITRLRSKVFPRKQAFNTRVGLSWRPGNNTDFKPTDANLWGITAGSTAGGWTAAHTSDQWKFGKHLYETYQDTLMGGETYAGGHTLAGKPIWPHGITNGIDGTFYMWGNVKHPDRGWDDYSITYHFALDSFQGEQGLTAGIPEHQYFLAQTIIDRTIAKDPSRYERFRTGTKNGSPVNTIRLQTTRATADQGINQGWDPSESGILAQGTQTSGISDLTYALNGSLAIPNNSTGDADVAGYNFDFYRDIITNINPGITYAGDTGASQGIYYRWYTHSTTPDGPIAIPPHGISHNIQKDTLGWRDRPNEIQMFDQAYGGGGVTYSDLFYTSATGPNDGKLTPLGEQLQTRRVTWFNQMISSYGGNDPRSYIGYLDPLVNKYTTPNGSALDINRFYYGPTGVNNINALKAIYDPNSKFPTGPVIKDIDLKSVITPGTGFTTVTTAADIPNPGGYPMALQGTVIMQWTDQPLRATESDSMTVGVVADHYNGMEKVTFIADNGTPVDVTSTVNTRGFDEYVATLDMSGVTVGTSVEVRAIGTPIAGKPRVLQNSIPTSTSVSNDWKEGKNSSFVTKAASVIESTTGITLGLVEIINDALPANANNNIYRITIPGGTYDTTNGDSQTYNTANPNIPIELVGVGDATVIQASTYARSSSHVFNGPLHFKNMKIIQGTVGFRPSGSNNPNSMHILENVNYDTLRQEPTIGSIYTDSVGGTYEWTPANNGGQTAGTEIAYLTKVYTDAANELGFVSAVTPTSSGDIGRGVWIMESTITGEVGENLRMLRNVQAKTLQDASHNSITLNLTMVNAQSGIGDPYVLQPDVQVWKPGVDYTGIPVLFTNPANGRAGLYGGGSADMLAPKDEFGRGNTGWYDASPHCDGWQSRPTNVIGATGDDYTMDNIWCEGLVCDDTSYVQPWFLRSSEALKNVMWKNWVIEPSTLSPGTPLTYSQIPTPMDHWVMDNCTWPAGAPEDVYGELLLSWEDPNDKIPNSGLGQICNDGVSTGLKNVIWRNSSVRNLTLAWNDTVQPQNPSPTVPTTFADMVSDFNGASYSNWSFAVDEFTAANSWLAGDGPVSPTNLVLVHSGLSEAQSTIGISSYTVDGSPTPYISSYQWYFDDALIGGVTGSTLALVDADIGKVPRVVVTATNNQGSTTAGYTFAGVTAEGGTENWSTWENGIWYVPSKENDPTGEIIEASSVYISTASQGMEGFGKNTNNYPMTRHWNITGGDTVPPAVAVWNKTETAWLGTSGVTANVPNASNSTVVYDTNPSANGYYGYTHVGDEIIIIYLTQAPLDFGNWPAYDGPTGP